MDKVHIPAKYMQDMKVVSGRAEWIDGEIKNNDSDLAFKGAIFDLNTSEMKLLQEQGIALTDVIKKIYCYIDITVGSTIECLDKNYQVINSRDYNNNADLRIYFIKRVDEIG